MQQLAKACFKSDHAITTRLNEQMDIIFGNGDLAKECHFFRLHGQLIAGHAIVIERTEEGNAKRLGQNACVELAGAIDWIDSATAKAELCMQSILAERALVSTGIMTFRTSDFAFSIIGPDEAL